MSKKVILITGANGEIGQSLIKNLNKQSIHNIIALDLENPTNNFNVEKFFIGSILDQKIIDEINDKYEIYSIYHLAAILSTKAEKNPKLANDVNINGTINLLDLASSQSIKQSKNIKFFFPSSIAVYNVQQGQKKEINEYEFCENPTTEYGKAKLQCEKIGQEHENVDFRD